MYFERGMQCDATFLKNCFGGTLLVSCYKDGNNNIRILAVAIVSTENENNWSQFLGLIKQNIVKFPACIISDREKGLHTNKKDPELFMCDTWKRKHIFQQIQKQGLVRQYQ